MFAFVPTPYGKYDTYKGSTLKSLTLEILVFDFGNYDTYKGLTLTNCKISSVPTYQGKYDTYKGSIHFTPEIRVFDDIGNYDTYKGSTLVHLVLNCIEDHFGKYDTYKGSILNRMFYSMLFIILETMLLIRSDFWRFGLQFFIIVFT